MSNTTKCPRCGSTDISVMNLGPLKGRPACIDCDWIDKPGEPRSERLTMQAARLALLEFMRDGLYEMGNNGTGPLTLHADALPTDDEAVTLSALVFACDIDHWVNSARKENDHAQAGV